MGIQNLWVLKILAGLRFVDTQKIVGTQICWYSYSFIDTEILGHSHLWVFRILWVLKICDDTKFQVSGREYQNISVLCISCEQKNICAFSIYAFCHMCKNIPRELGFRGKGKNNDIYKTILKQTSIYYKKGYRD